MKVAVRTALFVVPFALLFLAIRWLGKGDAERWRERVAPYCPGARVVVDERDLLVIAADARDAQAAAAEVRDFRRALVERYADLLGTPRFARMVVAVFPDARSVQAYAGQSARVDRGTSGKLQGYTDPLYGAVFVPTDAIETLRHETVHWVMETARGAGTPQYSPWLAEGLAQLFETFDPLDPQPPTPGPTNIRLIDVDRLVGIQSHADFMGPLVDRNYAEALLLCGFLFETRQKELLRYMDAERRSEEARPVAFRKILRSDEEPFRRDLAAYLERLS
ncbi:MAG TPA: hypothetical protein VFY93_10900 [Planctomycetota bacterium]|nr:hypothetical protein [Planctomycetota bacterium]